MGSLRRRLERLEDECGRSSACPECGIDPNAPIEYEVVLEDPPTPEEMRELREWYERGMPPGEEPSSEPEEESQRCARCGRWVLYVIDWDDAPTRGELRRLEAEMLARRDWVLNFPPRGWSGTGGGV